MARDDLIQMEGKVSEVLVDGHFRIDTEHKHEVMARLCGKMRKYRIRVLLGDRVTIGVSPYDTSRGLILHRHRN